MSSCNCTSLGVTNRTHIFSYSALPPESSIHQHRRSSKMRILLVYQVHLWRLRVIPIQLTNSRQTLFTSILFPCSCHTHSLPFSLAIHCSHHTTIHWLICAELQKKMAKKQKFEKPGYRRRNSIYCCLLFIYWIAAPNVSVFVLYIQCARRQMHYACRRTYVCCVCWVCVCLLSDHVAQYICFPDSTSLFNAFVCEHVLYIHRTTECRKIIHRTK